MPTTAAMGAAAVELLAVMEPVAKPKSETEAYRKP